MTSDRSAPPPEIPGFQFVRWLGGGGFADVFLYVQRRPARPVAVKVLRDPQLAFDVARRFDVEADLMARVSTHPYIVTILGVDAAPDGRPYIAMEHYPNPHFGDRAAAGALEVAEVLRVGVQLASALQAAHDAGIVHRDVKPANVLTSAYGRPGLTDFGISGVRTEHDLEEAVGVSVAYAPPEVLDGSSDGDEQGDVYSLAATLFTMATGHAPYHHESDDGSDAMARRVLEGPVPRLSRPDAPSSLEALLAQAMARRAQDRPADAAALARALQDIERELGLTPTSFEVQTAEADPAPWSDLDGERTVLRGTHRTNRLPFGSSRPPAGVAASSTLPGSGAPRPSPLAATAAQGSSGQAVGGGGPAGSNHPRRRAPRGMAVLAGTAVAAVLALGATALVGQDEEPPASEAATTTTAIAGPPSSLQAAATTTATVASTSTTPPPPATTLGTTTAVTAATEALTAPSVEAPTSTTLAATRSTTTSTSTSTTTSTTTTTTTIATTAPAPGREEPKREGQVEPAAMPMAPAVTTTVAPSERPGD